MTDFGSENKIHRHSESEDSNPFNYQHKMDLALMITRTFEDAVNAIDIEKLEDLYSSICTEDFTYVEEYIGLKSHPMKELDNVVVYKGYKKLLDVAANWSVSMPDMLFKYTGVRVKDEGRLIYTRWECTGTKISNVKYPDSSTVRPGQPDGSNTPRTDNVNPDISLFGTAMFHLTDDEKLFKMHFVVHTEK